MVRAIRVWADTHSTGILDENGGPIPHGATMISNTTWKDLQQWVRDYDYIIPLGVQERRERQREIEELDRRGLDLLRRIRNEWPVDSRTGEPLLFVYYSEGLMRPIAVD